MSGFESPNYTQAPNDFFSMLPDMSEAEIRVTLVMIRQTFGFHRDGFKMGVTKLANAAGLSRQGALDGAKAAEDRGTFKRANPEAQTEAEWELVVPLNVVEGGINPVEGEPLPSRGQSSIKEKIKKPIKEKKAAAKPHEPTPPEVLLFRSVTSRFPPRVNFEDVVKSVQKVTQRLGREATRDDLLVFYKKWTGLGYKPINLAWLEWAESGQIPQDGRWKPQKYQEPRAFEGIRQFLQVQEAINGVTD